MNNSNVILEAKTIYDRLRILDLTGSYGKAAVVEQAGTKEEKLAAKDMIELAGALRSFGAYTAGIIRYKIRRIQDKAAQEALKDSASSLKRAINNLAFQLASAVNGGSVSYLRTAPMLVEKDGLTSSAGATTSLAHIAKLVYRIESGKTDLVSTLAQEVMRITDLAYSVNVVKERDLTVHEVSDKFTKWADEIRLPSNTYNFAATRNMPTVFKGNLVSHLKLSAEVVGTDPREDAFGDGVYNFTNTVLTKKNGVVTLLS